MNNECLLPLNEYGMHSNKFPEILSINQFQPFPYRYECLKYYEIVDNWRFKINQLYQYHLPIVLMVDCLLCIRQKAQTFNQNCVPRNNTIKTVY